MIHIERITRGSPYDGVTVWELFREFRFKLALRELFETLPCRISRLFDKPDKSQLVDEVVVINADVHLERMYDGGTCLIIDHSESDTRVVVNIWAAGKDDLRVRAEVE